MIDSIIGILIHLYVGMGYLPMQLDPYIRPPLYGGHMNADITLQIEDHWQPRYAAFVVVEGLADCMSPENVSVRDLNGHDVPFMIQDGPYKDTTRTWAIVPKNKFKFVRVIIDIDFVNKCDIA